MNPIVLQPRAAFAKLHASDALSSGLVAVERSDLRIASLSARNGKRAELVQRFQDCFDIALPPKPRRVALGSVSAASLGPGKWLVMFEGDADGFERMMSAVDGCASVVDQTDAFGVLRLSGPILRETLAKLVPLDLHRVAFAVGDVASTLAAHLRVVLWRVEDDPLGHPVFELAVYRSLADSLWHELEIHALQPHSDGQP